MGLNKEEVIATDKFCKKKAVFVLSNTIKKCLRRRKIDPVYKA